MSHQGQKRCKRHGCLKHYNEAENVEGACHFHPGKPIFHDLKKGWTCCNKIVYDWDEFQKLPACATGKHTDQKDEANGGEFYKSNTVTNASNALKKEEQKIVIKDINQYNKEQQEKKKKAEQSNKQQKKPFVKDGKFKCINQGCNKGYVEAENGAEACKYHKGTAVFHDLKKFWTCCGKQTHDWDQFMKLPTCCIGWHSPKMV